MFNSKIYIVADSYKDYRWLVDEFKKRLWKKVYIEEIKPYRSLNYNDIIKKETDKIFKILSKDKNFKILLSLNGECKTTEELKEIFVKNKKISFIIWWAYWLDENKLDKYIDFKLSFWKHTKSHILVLVELLEQIYRINNILSWWKYHK